MSHDPNGEFPRRAGRFDPESIVVAEGCPCGACHTPSVEEVHKHRDLTIVNILSAAASLRIDGISAEWIRERMFKQFVERSEVPMVDDIREIGITSKVLRVIADGIDSACEADLDVLRAQRRISDEVH